MIDEIHYYHFKLLSKITDDGKAYYCGFDGLRQAVSFHDATNTS
jgi:hypothetical protein